MPHASVAGVFNGFPREAFDFFEQLALHNHRDWFQAHREQYERACREPMKQLVAELGAKQAKLSRINRDVRFSRDKSPYRTYIAAGADGNYISLSAAGLYVSAGIYKPEPAALERFRSAIASNESGPSLQRIVTPLLKKGYRVDTHEKLISAPRGYPLDPPRIELLRTKGIFAGQTFGPETWLSTRSAFGRVRQVANDVKPLRTGFGITSACGSRQPRRLWVDPTPFSRTREDWTTQDRRTYVRIKAVGSGCKASANRQPRLEATWDHSAQGSSVSNDRRIRTSLNSRLGAARYHRNVFDFRNHHQHSVLGRFAKKTAVDQISRCGSIFQ